jgi:XapX domain-containing protein
MAYLISLGVGLGVGLLYSLLRVQSPAPPIIALIGLLGMVIGEHAIPTIKSQLAAMKPPVEQVYVSAPAPDHQDIKPPKG